MIDNRKHIDANIVPIRIIIFIPFECIRINIFSIMQDITNITEVGL